MKQKFTLNIADIQLSVIADASRDEVEHIRGLLDRKMREIYLKSRCPKTEAALLCAMEFAADRMTLQAQITALSEQCEKYALVLDGLKERNADQTAELERLRSENAVLRSLLTKDEAPAVAPDPISPTAFFAEVAEAQMQSPTPFEEITDQDTDPKQIEIFDMPTEEPVEEFSEEPAEESVIAETVAETPIVEEPVAVEPIVRSRSRVGSMFEQLSFGDVD
ncbi:MAG: cell division protein ZapA [Clostridia bacterium]|nr:cell division protein ZapA [Clostridia bacterium]